MDKILPKLIFDCQNFCNQLQTLQTVFPLNPDITKP